MHTFLYYHLPITHLGLSTQRATAGNKQQRAAPATPTTMGGRQPHLQQATAGAHTMTATRGSNDFGVRGQPQQALFS